MSQESRELPTPEEIWRSYLTGEGDYAGEGRMRRYFTLLPKDPRCKLCHAPFSGVGGTVVKVLTGKRPSRLNPHLCNVCDEYAEEYQGGAEIELSMLFADVRGSTPLSQQLEPAQYSRLINRFYQMSTDVLVHADALIEKLIGDAVVALFVPGFAGPDHARKAVRAGQELLRATGHEGREGLRIPVGVGVHTGVAFVGSVGSKGGVNDIAALGNDVNNTARLASVAAPGELLVSEATLSLAGLGGEGWVRREYALKGIEGPFPARSWGETSAGR